MEAAVTYNELDAKSEAPEIESAAYLRSFLLQRTADTLSFVRENGRSLFDAFEMRRVLTNQALAEGRISQGEANKRQLSQARMYMATFNLCRLRVMASDTYQEAASNLRVTSNILSREFYQEENLQSIRIKAEAKAVGVFSKILGAAALPILKITDALREAKNKVVRRKLTAELSALSQRIQGEFLESLTETEKAALIDGVWADIDRMAKIQRSIEQIINSEALAPMTLFAAEATTQEIETLSSQFEARNIAITAIRLLFEGVAEFAFTDEALQRFIATSLTQNYLLSITREYTALQYQAAFHSRDIQRAEELKSRIGSINDCLTELHAQQNEEFSQLLQNSGLSETQIEQVQAVRQIAIQEIEDLLVFLPAIGGQIGNELPSYDELWQTTPNLLRTRIMQIQRDDRSTKRAFRYASPTLLCKAPFPEYISGQINNTKLWKGRIRTAIRSFNNDGEGRAGFATMGEIVLSVGCGVIGQIAMLNLHKAIGFEPVPDPTPAEYIVGGILSKIFLTSWKAFNPGSWVEDSPAIPGFLKKAASALGKRMRVTEPVGGNEGPAGSYERIDETPTRTENVVFLTNEEFAKVQPFLPPDEQHTTTLDGRMVILAVGYSGGTAMARYQRPYHAQMRKDMSAISFERDDWGQVVTEHGRPKHTAYSWVPTSRFDASEGMRELGILADPAGSNYVSTYVSGSGEESHKIYLPGLEEPKTVHSYLRNPDPQTLTVSSRVLGMTPDSAQKELGIKTQTDGKLLWKWWPVMGTVGLSVYSAVYLVETGQLPPLAAVVGIPLTYALQRIFFHVGHGTYPSINWGKNKGGFGDAQYYAELPNPTSKDVADAGEVGVGPFKYLWQQFILDQIDLNSLVIYYGGNLLLGLLENNPNKNEVWAIARFLLRSFIVANSLVPTVAEEISEGIHMLSGAAHGGVDAIPDDPTPEVYDTLKDAQTGLGMQGHLHDLSNQAEYGNKAYLEKVREALKATGYTGPVDDETLRQGSLLIPSDVKDTCEALFCQGSNTPLTTADCNPLVEIVPDWVGGCGLNP